MSTLVVLTVWTSNCMVFKFYARHINGRRKSHSISISLILQMILKANKLFQKHKGIDINFLSFMHSRVAFFILTTLRLIHGNTLVDDTYHCLTGQHFLQLKDAPFSSADQRPSKVCHLCYAHSKRTSQGGRLKTTYIYKSCPS